MTAGRAKAPMLCIQHAVCETAIFFGGQTRVRLDLFRHDWMMPANPANVLTLSRHRQSVGPKAVFKMAIPANDNMPPLD